jgi:hypothetical protein
MDSAITCVALAGVEGFMAQSLPPNTATLFDAGLAEKCRTLLVAHVRRSTRTAPVPVGWGGPKLWSSWSCWPGSKTGAARSPANKECGWPGSACPTPTGLLLVERCPQFAIEVDPDCHPQRCGERVTKCLGVLGLQRDLRQLGQRPPIRG